MGEEVSRFSHVLAWPNKPKRGLDVGLSCWWCIVWKGRGQSWPRFHSWQGQGQTWPRGDVMKGEGPR
ncbi:hypothetical protein PIB30_088656, partial [Stylosanthes scabra]|nr:hypothetical protein [Stylosanthes scabra]